MNEAKRNEESDLTTKLGAHPACKGTNCGCTDGRSHSIECRHLSAYSLSTLKQSTNKDNYSIAFNKTF